MKKILVTGGAGFIGSHICLKLLKEGHVVTSLDNYYTGNTNNLTPCQEFESFNEITHDIVEPCLALFSDEKFDLIYHLACPASPVHYQSDPIKTTMTSVLGTYHLLELAKRDGAKLLFSSTSEVYGDPEEHPQKESYRGFVNPHGIRACYDEGKRAGESLCFDYHRHHGLPVKVVRIFNTYGENMNPEDGRVVSNFIMQTLRGEVITAYGDGTQTRSFCYVSDLVEGIVRMMNDESSWPGPVNLGNPNEMTVNELAVEVKRQIGVESETRFLPLPSDDPTRRCPDISVAKEKLGWEPKVGLSEGLEKTIEYFRHAKSW